MSLISNPHTLQRYLTLTLRISPEGGGGGIGVVKLLSRPMPLFHRTTAMARPATSQMMVDSAGINHHATPEVRPVAIGRAEGLAEALDDRGVRHATAFAHRLQPVPATGALELIEQCRHQART